MSSTGVLKGSRSSPVRMRVFCYSLLGSFFLQFFFRHQILSNRLILPSNRHYLIITNNQFQHKAKLRSFCNMDDNKVRIIWELFQFNVKHEVRGQFKLMVVCLCGRKNVIIKKYSEKPANTSICCQHEILLQFRTTSLSLRKALAEHLRDGLIKPRRHMKGDLYSSLFCTASLLLAQLAYGQPKFYQQMMVIYVVCLTVHFTSVPVQPVRPIATGYTVGPPKILKDF